MPLYTFEHTETAEQLSIQMSYEELKEAEKDLLESGWERVFQLNMVGSIKSGPQHDDRFDQVLKNIKAGSGSGCTINTK